MENQIVVFELAGEQFGVYIHVVESIIKMQSVTQMPNSPDFVEGIINLRGKILPIIDLHKRFALTRQGQTKNSRIVVVGVGETTIGMEVDGVSEVLTVPEDTIEATPPLTANIDTGFIKGIAKIGERLVILLDLQEVFNEKEKESLQEVVQPALAGNLSG